MPIPPIPFTEPFILIVGSRTKGTRDPNESARDDSIVMAPSDNFDIAVDSASWVIRPTIVTSSYILLSRRRGEQQYGTYVGGGRRVTELRDIVMCPNEVRKVVNNKIEV